MAESGVLLEIEGLMAGFGNGPVLFGIDMDVREGELIALIGSNGAGKSTLLGTLTGLVQPMAGQVRFGGRDVTGLRPEVMVRAGMVHVPQGRRLFGTLTVEQNLVLGAYSRRDRRHVKADLERTLHYFPALEPKLRQVSGTMSGGEQQMVAIARGLMGRPRLLMIDELSLGLAPKIVERLLEVVQEINQDGTAVLLVEQDVLIALEVAHRGFVLENGQVVLHGPCADLMHDPKLREAYLGV